MDRWVADREWPATALNANESEKCTAKKKTGGIFSAYYYYSTANLLNFWATLFSFFLTQHRTRTTS